MDNRINVLIAKVSSELAKLKKLKAQHDSDFPQNPEKEPSYTQKAAIGYNLHNFYNGCENIFRNISEYYENNLSGSRFHKDLLERMTFDIPKIRPRIISDALFDPLSEFLAFRHKFRHMYSFELNWERERRILDQLDDTYEMIE